jgi:hypothetical protein
MSIMRGLGLLFLVLGAAMLAGGLTGVGEEWIAQNVACGDRHDAHACARADAQGLLTLVGAILVAVAAVELAVSAWWGRISSA